MSFKLIQHCSPAYLLACAIMLLLTLSFNFIVQSMEWTLHKDPIPLRKSLIQLDARFGPYQVRQKEERLSRDIESALGSQDYITWYFQKYDELGNPTPEAIRLHIVYYSGSVDQIPHVPERCYIAGGLVPSSESTRKLNLHLNSPPLLEKNGSWFAPDKNDTLQSIPGNLIGAREFRFTMPTLNDLNTSVIYFFIANHQYLAERGRIKALMFDLTRSTAYFAKVEVMSGKWTEQAGETSPRFMPDLQSKQTELKITNFLSYAIGPIMACLPADDATHEKEQADG